MLSFFSKQSPFLAQMLPQPEAILNKAQRASRKFPAN